MQITMQVGTPPLPKEHGAWAMLITPPVVAAAALGLNLWGCMAVFGWFFAYCLRGPMEALQGSAPTGRAGMTHARPEVARFWLLVFGLVAMLLLGPVLYRRPWTLALLVGALLLLLGVKRLADEGQTRSISAGLLAILGLMAGGPLYYLAALGTLPAQAWILAFASGAFFVGSIFRVKTLVREKRSGTFRLISVGLHVIAVLAAVGWVHYTGASPLLTVAMVAPLLWAIYGALRAGEPVSLMGIGRSEQWLTMIFGVMLIAALRMS